MKPSGFLDTNILVYAFTDDRRSSASTALLASGCATGVQALNEFANVARRKLGFGWDEIDHALLAIRTLCLDIVPLDLSVHGDGLSIAQRYRMAVFDALLVAAALKAGCHTFWSEDMHDGLVVDGRLRVANPFTTT